MPKKKAKLGRPNDYNPDYAEMLIKHMEDGYSFESFGGVVRCNRSTLYEWVEKFPDFSDAKSIGWCISLKYWEQVGKEGLYNETIKEGKDVTITRSINASIWIFNMKNRFGWRDAKDESPEDDKKKTAQQETVDQLLDWLVKINNITEKK